MFNVTSSLAVICLIRHPFLDPYDTLQRPDLPLTVHEYDEYGNPDDPQAIECIQSYSPCSNVRVGKGDGDGDRPAMFLSTGLQDTSVGPWEALKWTEMVRDSSTVISRPVLLSVTPDCGHSGSSSSLEDNWLKAAEIVFLESSIDNANNPKRTTLKRRIGTKNGRKRL
jgi:oligopeptidase B